MWLASFLCYIFFLLLTLSGIQVHINMIKYPFYLSLSLTLAVFIPLSIIFLLPIDYILHNSPQRVIWFDLPDKVILYLWKTNYWVTFLLTWLLLPVLQEFYKSGHHNRFDRLKDALKSNLKFQLIILGVSIAGMVYLILEVGLTLGHLKLMIIAMSHIYSLVLALWLMTHGLISIPRNKWISGNILQNLNHHYLKVPKLVDSLEDTKISFKEEILQVLILTKNYTSSSPEDFRFRDWILELYHKVPGELKECMERQYLNDKNNSISRDQLTEQFMTKLTSNFNSNLHKLLAYDSEFDNLLIKILKLEDILDAKTNSNLEARNQLTFRVGNHKTLLPPKANFIYHYYIKPIVNRVMSIVLFAASFIIIQSEFFHSTKLSLINILVYSTGINNFNLLKLAVLSITFSYMLFASLNSLTQLKIFNMYHLVPHKSDPVSACFYATYIARLTIPLSYNFITLFISRNSIFEEWFGKSIHLTGLFNLMNNWIPRLVLIPIILTVFNVYDKLKKKLDLNSDLYDSWATFDDDSEEEHQNNDVENLSNKRKDLMIVEAKRIINREIFKRQHQKIDNLRPFNLASASDATYENNRRNFHDSLVSSTDNRIDSDYRDNIDDISLQLDRLNVSILPTDGNSSVWGKISGALTELRDSVSTRFSNQREYRDEVIDNFNYDDQNDTLVL